MITGIHTILYSHDAEGDRAFFRDKLNFPALDIGRGWLIFKMPPGEAAFHPIEGDTGAGHELYLMCDDVKAEMAALAKKGVMCSPIHEERWGSLTYMDLPGGSRLGMYQPKHPLAIDLP